MDFEWDDENTSHIGRHGIDRHTAESVFSAEDASMRRVDALRLVVHGTVSGRMHRIVVAFVGPATLRIITAHRIRKGRAK